MSAKLEKLLTLLSDTLWHDINEIAKTLEIPQEKMWQAVQFLIKMDVIQHNPTTNQIKLNQNWKTLLINQKETPNMTQAQTKQETATAIGTIIIPPQKSLIIQCTRITNLTDTSLELEIRINKKLNDIAINKIY